MDGFYLYMNILEQKLNTVIVVLFQDTIHIDLDCYFGIPLLLFQCSESDSFAVFKKAFLYCLIIIKYLDMLFQKRFKIFTIMTHFWGQSVLSLFK